MILFNIACAHMLPRNVVLISEDECQAVGNDGVIDSIMTDAIANDFISGGVVCVTNADSILYLRAFGYRQVYPDTLPMMVNTIFDLASLTKPTSTAMCVFALYKDGKLDLNDLVSNYVPQIKDDFTIVHLLSHTSGLPAYLNVSNLLENAHDRDLPYVLLDSISHCPRLSPTGKRYRYSCLNYILLQHVIENIENKPLYEVAEERVFKSLGMFHTCYMPDSTLFPLIAPTEMQPDSTILHGVVHDPLARVMNNGNSGNAGVFSSAYDLALLAQYLLKNKDEKYIVEMSSVPDSLAFAKRTLGWQINSKELTYTGNFFSENAYCHTGYTGTSMIIDPEKKICLIILTNRVHPHDSGNITLLRASIADEVVKNFCAIENK